MDHDLDLGVRYMAHAAHLGMDDPKNGSRSASNKMDALAKKMSHAQIDKAQDMSRRCLLSHYKYCGVTEKEAEKLAEVIQIIESMIADEGTSTY